MRLNPDQSLRDILEARTHSFRRSARLTVPCHTHSTPTINTQTIDVMETQEAQRTPVIAYVAVSTHQKICS